MEFFYRVYVGYVGSCGICNSIWCAMNADELTNDTLIVPSSTEQARRWLQAVKSMPHVSWHRLSVLLRVPASTLWRFANGGKLPHKYKKNLGIYYDRKLIDMPVEELRWALDNRS